MPWTRPDLALRCIGLLLLSEFVRTGLVVAFLPLMAASRFSPAQIGLVVSAHYLLDALAKGPMGAATQHLGLGRVLLGSAGVGLGFVISFLLGAAFWLLLLLAAAWGLLYAALWPGVMALSQQYARPGREAQALSLTSLSVAPAIALGALGVGELMQRHAQAAAALLLGAQGAVMVLALSVLGVRLGVRLGLPMTAAPHSSWTHWKRVGALLPAAFAQTLAPGLLITLFYPLLFRLNLSLRDLLLPALLGVALLLITLLHSGKLADQRGPRVALGPGLGLLALGFWLCGSPGALPGALLPLAALIGVGYGAFVAGWNGLVGLSLPPTQRAAGWGVVMATEALGYALGPLLGGAVYAAAGVRVFWLGAAVFVLAQLYYLLPGRALGIRPGSAGVRLDTERP